MFDQKPVRSHTSVAIFDNVDDTKMIAHFLLFRHGHICRVVDGVSTQVMDWQFEEWFSFSYMIGCIIAVRVCNEDFSASKRWEIKRPA